ncbi:pyruvate kinase [uncultured Croceitalea sp.]|uniref:pyruvate kinase n=1 Tax=uncultured Croceitalea sp. TaxID=1798908 RepID=UPI003305C46A
MKFEVAQQKALKTSIQQPEELISAITAIIDRCKVRAREASATLELVHPENRASAINLLQYQVLREFDLRGVQQSLKSLGLTRLANAEGHVLFSLLNTKYILEVMTGQTALTIPTGSISIDSAEELLAHKTASLLGSTKPKRRVRIMVTQPTQAATDYELVYNMVKNGMDCARINCAHDNPEIWLAIINNIKRAAKALDRKVKIAMDLGGPKIRTGTIEEGPRVQKLKPKKDSFGKVVEPARIQFVEAAVTAPLAEGLPMRTAWLKQLQKDDVITYKDVRGKKRKLLVAERTEESITAHSYKTAYVSTETEFTLKRNNEMTTILDLPPLSQAILLRKNDTVTLMKVPMVGQLPKMTTDGQLLKEACLSCYPKEVFDVAKIGEPILFDDGKIEGEIVTVQKDSFQVKITHAKEGGAKLKSEKGINFPTLDLGLKALTSIDKENLRFVAEYADIVNFSFVNSKEDVGDLLNELEKLDALDKLDVVLKIETGLAYENLFSILLQAMRSKTIGVMIARGDLAIETGWENIGTVQDEILSICSAGHVPVIWATQVLESLAKNGLPSRSEITDVAMSLKAECVMLNKGPYIDNAIQLLDKILILTENHRQKKERMLPRIKKAGF